MSVKQVIIDNAFAGVQDPFRQCLQYAGDPNGNLELTSVSPYGKGTLCWSTTEEKAYYKTDTDSTDWQEID